MRFLTEDTAPKLISEMLADAPFAKLAVAFWGDRAAARLGVGTHKSQTKIICNLESGACNPFEIRRLLEMAPDVEVRSNPRLHAKVYWTPRAAIVGSSNASSNGLAVEGKELSSWLEANTFVNDPAMLAEVSDWFDKIFDDQLSRQIREEDLRRAEDVWNNRRLVVAPGIQVANNLLDTCRKSITHPAWQRTKVTFWQDPPTRNAEEMFATIKAERSWGEDYSYYEGWQDKLFEGDWVFDFPMKTPLKAKFEHIWHIQPYSAETPTLSLAIKSKMFNPKAFGKLTLTDADKERIASTAEHFVQMASDKRNAVVPLIEIVAHLDRSERRTDFKKPTIAQFEAAMANIYRETRAAGYIASGFWRMLQEQGAMSTARRLVLSPQPSPGFGELLLLNRLDLTVEALIVQEPWRQLFEPEVIAAAQRRLDQFALR